MKIQSLATHPEELLTYEEVAAYLRVETRTVSRYVAKGALVSVRVGRFSVPRIPLASLKLAMGRPWPPKNGDGP